MPRRGGAVQPGKLGRELRQSGLYLRRAAKDEGPVVGPREDPQHLGHRLLERLLVRTPKLEQEEERALDLPIGVEWPLENLGRGGV